MKNNVIDTVPEFPTDLILMHLADILLLSFPLWKLPFMPAATYYYLQSEVCKHASNEVCAAVGLQHYKHQWKVPQVYLYVLSFPVVKQKCENDWLWKRGVFFDIYNLKPSHYLAAAFQNSMTV